MFCHIWLSDYFSFRSLQNSSNGKNFNNDDDIESYLIQFFANKNHKFYELGMLPERSLIKMGNTLQFHEKIVFDFLKKNPQLLSCQPNRAFVKIKEGMEE